MQSFPFLLTFFLHEGWNILFVVHLDALKINACDCRPRGRIKKKRVDCHLLILLTDGQKQWRLSRRQWILARLWRRVRRNLVMFPEKLPQGQKRWGIYSRLTWRIKSQKEEVLEEERRRRVHSKASQGINICLFSETSNSDLFKHPSNHWSHLDSFYLKLFIVFIFIFFASLFLQWLDICLPLLLQFCSYYIGNFMHANLFYTSLFNAKKELWIQIPFSGTSASSLWSW